MVRRASGRSSWPMASSRRARCCRAADRREGCARARRTSPAAPPSASRSTAPPLAAARALLERLLGLVEGVRVLAPGSARAPSILAAVLPGPPAEVWMHHLEARGVMTSAGSACHAKTKAVSPALIALGLSPDEARRVLRFSFARTTTAAEVEEAAAALGAVARELGVGAA